MSRFSLLTALPPLALLAALGLGACAGPLPVVAPCKGYCRTQEDGYQWARQAALSDARACGGYTPAFVDGCRDAVTDFQKSFTPGRDAYLEPR